MTRSGRRVKGHCKRALIAHDDYLPDKRSCLQDNACDVGSRCNPRYPYAACGDRASRRKSECGCAWCKSECPILELPRWGEKVTCQSIETDAWPDLHIFRVRVVVN